MKKGELSINVVVMAVVALLVLIVLSIIVIRNLSRGEKEANACDKAKGTCIGSGGSCGDDIHYSMGDCDKDNNWCCVSRENVLKTG